MNIFLSHEFCELNKLARITTVCGQATIHGDHDDKYYWFSLYKWPFGFAWGFGTRNVVVSTTLSDRLSKKELDITWSLWHGMPSGSHLSLTRQCNFLFTLCSQEVTDMKKIAFFTILIYKALFVAVKSS